MLIIIIEYMRHVASKKTGFLKNFTKSDDYFYISLIMIHYDTPNDVENEHYPIFNTL